MTTAVSEALVTAPSKASNKWAIAAAVALGALLEIIDTSIVNVALTDIQATLGATLSQVSWVVSAYAIANVIILPLSAWLGMRFGKKRYFVFSLVGFTLASMLCGTSTTLPMLVIARVIQGLTGGGLLAKAQSILFETFPPEEQATAQGFFGAIVIAGPAIGPTLGGWLTTNVGWRWIFFVNLPLGIVATFATLAVLPKDEPRKDTGRVDWTGIGLLALGIGSFQAFLEQGNDEDWFSSRLIVTLALSAAVGITAFVVQQLRSKSPVVDLRLFRHRSLWAGSLLSVVIGMALYGALFAIPIFAATVLHYTSQQVGMLLLPGALASAFTMPISAALSRKMDPRLMLVLGASILVTSLLMLGHLSPTTSAEDLFWPLVVRAIGTVLMFLPLQLAALGKVPKPEIAGATGLFNLTRQLGGSVGVALLTTLLEHRSAFHRAILVEKLNDGAPATLERLAAYTRALGSHDKALALLDGGVNLQSAVMSFNDTFWATAVLVIMTAPLVFLLQPPAKGVKVEMGH